MQISNKKWIIFFTVFALLCAAVWMLFSKTPTGRFIAEIKQGNTVIKTIDLAELSEPYEFEIVDESGGYNKIRAEQGRIAVIDADCQDRICVNQGYIENGTVPIVCLPHRMSIVIAGDGETEVDAVAGGN